MLVILLFSVVALVILIWIAYSYFGSRAEHLGYQVLDKSKEYEVRKLDDYLVAETSIKGDFGTAGNRAFNILAGYIFGNNKKRQKIAMTTPVIEAESEKIAMTTPVISEEAGNNKKNVSFVLPSKYKMDNVPEPNDERVTLRAVKNRQVAVLRFRGYFSNSTFLKKRKELEKYLTRDGVKYGTISSARYNPPWTMPFMQRNEVWAEVIG